MYKGSKRNIRGLRRTFAIILINNWKRSFSSTSYDLAFCILFKGVPIATMCLNCIPKRFIIIMYTIITRQTHYILLQILLIFLHIWFSILLAWPCNWFVSQSFEFESHWWVVCRHNAGSLYQMYTILVILSTLGL